MRIIVTGGTGLLARYIAYEMAGHADELLAVVSDSRADVAKVLYKDYPQVQVVPKSVFCQSAYLKEKMPGACVIHTAFTRKNDGTEIAASLDYAYSLFSACKEYAASSVLNISSRSVYEEPKEWEVNNEASAIRADSLIAAAKYGTELMLKAFFQGGNVRYASVRVASVNELKMDHNMVRPLNVFVDCVMKGESIKVFNGKQIMSFVDPRDVACAIRLMCLSSAEWKDTYNIGAGQIGTMTLLKMAEKVVAIGERLGYPKVSIDVIEKDIHQTAGLDISRIQKDFGYVPKISLDDMIVSLFEMKRDYHD